MSRRIWEIADKPFVLYENEILKLLQNAVLSKPLQHSILQ